MKKYRIAIEETLRKVVEIEAETPGLAVCRAEDEYNGFFFKFGGKFFSAHLANSVNAYIFL